MDVSKLLLENGVQFTRRLEFLSVLCPFHKDTNPSGQLHYKKGSFFCYACGKGTTFVPYFQAATNKDASTVRRLLGWRSDCKNPVAWDDVERYHQEIWHDAALLQALKDRAVAEADIRKYRLGRLVHAGVHRITIPIMNAVGEVCNLRLYAPGAASGKFLNLSGSDRSKVRLFPFDQMDYDMILVCPGEMKAIAAARILNPLDIGAVAPTCGENFWPSEYSKLFEGKLVFVVGDIDEAGALGADRRCRALKGFAREVRLLSLDLDPLAFPSGDLNDFLRLGKSLPALIDASTEYVPSSTAMTTGDDIPLEMTLSQVFTPSNVGKRVATLGKVSAVGSKVSLVPSKIKVHCSRSHAYCTNCAVHMMAYIPDVPMTLGKESVAMLACSTASARTLPDIYRATFAIPPECKEAKFEEIEQNSLTYVSVDEVIAADARDKGKTAKDVFVVNCPVELTTGTYRMTGRLYPSPKDRTETLLVSELEPAIDSLDSYRPAPIGELSIFQPEAWTVEHLTDKLNDIYADLTANIVKVYGRQDMLLGADLCWHSPLLFSEVREMPSLKLTTAWLSILIVGDTGEGKSEGVNSLLAHYGVGYKVDCKNVTLAGLVIGLERRDDRYVACFGALPANDRMLVILEELKGMNEEVFRSLTEVRSSGIARTTKILSASAPARVRLLAITNPVSGRTMRSYVHGIDAALAICGTPEDLRRFDLIVTVANGEVANLDDIRENPPVVEHKYFSHLCQQLILKAWTVQNIEFEDIAYLVREAKKLVKLFGEVLPIFSANSAYIKLARLAAALAARTCSYSDDNTLLVRTCHVDYMIQYLERVYNSPSCGLGEKTRLFRESSTLGNVEALTAFINRLSNPKAVMDCLMAQDTITRGSIEDIVGNRDLGLTFLALLKNSRAVIDTRKGYNKTPQFIAFANAFQYQAIPAHLKSAKTK